MYNTKGLDQDLVNQARRGKTFGAEDKARYDALARAREVKKNPVKPDTPKEDLNTPVYAGGNPNAAGSMGKPTNAIDNTTTGENDKVPSNRQINDNNAASAQKQSVNQNNDITSNVTGNNNTVVNTQDNSIRQYGGDNRSFVYNSKGDGSDTPVSAATMSGFYDVDDSPAAQAKFNDMYTTMNRDNQKRFAGEGLATAAKYSNFDARSYTNESMENYLNRSTQYSYDRADRQTGLVFGDIWNPNYITEEWKMPSAPKAIESNAEDIAEKAKKDIEDI